MRKSVNIPPIENSAAAISDSTVARESLPNALSTNSAVGKALTSLPVASVEFIGLRSDAPALQRKYLDQAYEIYERSFPDPDERLSRQGFENYATDPKRTGYELQVIVKDGEVIGGANYRVMELSDLKIGYQGYTYVREDCRGQGMGGELFKHVCDDMKSRGAVAMFGEMNDPFAMTEQQISVDTQHGMDPFGRRAMWIKAGRMALDAYYDQPGYEGGYPVTSLLLNMKAFESSFTGLSGKQYIEMITEFFKPWVDGFENDPTYLKIVRWAEAQEFIPLIPLDQKRSCLETKE